METTTAISLVLANPVMRAELGRNPQQLQQRLGLSDDDFGTLQNFDAEELERQAECYLQKRFYEMAELIPASLLRIGSGAQRLFRKYAIENWPEGHRRRLNDAIAFVSFAGRQGRAVDRRELRRLQRIRETLVARAESRD